METEQSSHAMDAEKFQKLVTSKWKVSLSLTAIMMSAYFGFILVLAYAPHLLSVKLGEYMTLGIPIGIAIIVLAFVLTGIYVFWANSSYDRQVQDVLKSMESK
jgi:uncharacterized membrane protein (DUF485 family)